MWLKLCIFSLQIFSNFWNPDDGDEENEEEDLLAFSGRDGVLFVVDAATVAKDEIQFRDCLNLIETTMMNRIIHSERDLVTFLYRFTKKIAFFILF